MGLDERYQAYVNIFANAANLNTQNERNTIPTGSINSDTGIR